MRRVAVDERAHVLAHDALDEGPGLAGGHRLGEVGRVEDLAGREPGELGGDLGLPAMEEPLEAQAEDSHWLLRVEDELEGDPVGRVAHEEARRREHVVPWDVDPDDHLHEAEEEAEPDPRALDEEELGRADLAKHLAHQAPVLEHGLHHDLLEVEDGGDVGAEVVDDADGDRPHLLGQRVPDLALHDLAGVGPELRCPLRGHLIENLVGHLSDYGVEVLREGLAREGREELLERQELRQDQLRRHLREAPRVLRNDALPAKKGPDPNEFRRVEHHADGHDVGEPANEGAEEGDEEDQRVGAYAVHEAHGGDS